MSRLRAMGPLLAFAALWLLFELPAAVLHEPFRPSADPLALASAWVLAGRAPRGRSALRALCTGAWLLLIVHRLDRAGFLLFMGEEPLAYDQLFLIRHLFVLVTDLWSTALGLAVAGVLAGLALVVYVTRKLLGALVLPDDQAAQQRLLRGAGALWVAALAGSFIPFGGTRLVRWESHSLAMNLRQSARIYAQVHAQLGVSPYRDFAALQLTRRPDIYLMLVESYGRLIVEHPSLRKRYEQDIRRMSEELTAQGWHAVSGYSRAPVMGGRSWLAEATLLMGTRVSYEAVFQHLVSEIERVPNLVSFLAAQGYNTVLLAPSERARPGIQNENRYRYAQRVQFEELDYKGKKYGWGIVPDQYSLAHTHEHVLAQAARPLFFNFHMVTSHAPWKPLPELAEDWRSLRRDRDEPLQGVYEGSPFRPLRYFSRQTEIGYMGELGEELAENYRRAIGYELDVIRQYLAPLRGDALVIVIGDHQPPFIAASSRRFDTPIHVLARDPALLEELRSSGFSTGWKLSPAAPTTLLHESFFPLLVRALARCCSLTPELPLGHAALKHKS